MLAGFHLARVQVTRRQGHAVLGDELRACSYSPLTGYFRDGCCATHGQDGVAHLVCVQVTEEFLEFSVERGNDLVTPRPDLRFRGLKPGEEVVTVGCLILEQMYEDRLMVEDGTLL